MHSIHYHTLHSRKKIAEKNKSESFKQRKVKCLAREKLGDFTVDARVHAREKSSEKYLRNEINWIETLR